jgi:hypothetical protein
MEELEGMRINFRMYKFYMHIKLFRPDAGWPNFVRDLTNSSARTLSLRTTTKAVPLQKSPPLQHYFLSIAKCT